MTIYLTRHGESEWNLSGRLQGSLDSALTEKGRAESQALKHKLEQLGIDLDLVYSSPSSRTLETANLIVDHQKIPIIEDTALKEMDPGSWKALTWSVIQKKHPVEYKRYWQKPSYYQASNGGENFKEVQERAVSFVDAIIRKKSQKNILIVSHGVVLNSLFNYYNNGHLEHLWQHTMVGGGSLSRLDVYNEQVKITKLF